MTESIYIIVHTYHIFSSHFSPGIVLSGNEISQIMLSLILSYIGGQRNRPRWIAWGIVLCGVSCFILVLPHFIYGAGHEVLQLTKEYQESHDGSSTLNFNITLAVSPCVPYWNNLHKSWMCFHRTQPR